MAKKILISYDFNKNEIQNALMHPVASDPGTPSAGQLWFNSTESKLKYYDGSAVQTLASGGGIAELVEDTTPELGGNLNRGAYHIVDSNGAAIIVFSDVASAVNEVTIRNAATGNDPGLSATGGDPNLNFNIIPKGSGRLQENGTNVARVTDLHTQNTDTGTTSVSFGVETGGTGFLLKNSSGEAQIRTAADDGYANFRCGNLYVEGTTFTVNSETITVDDNIIVLNNNVTGAPTEDGGIEVERGTEANSQMLWDESSDQWVANDGTSTKAVARKHAQDIGNGADTEITVTHDLNTEDVQVSVRYAGGTKQVVGVAWRPLSATQVRVDFAVAPASNEFRVVVTG